MSSLGKLRAMLSGGTMCLTSLLWGTSRRTGALNTHSRGEEISTPVIRIKCSCREWRSLSRPRGADPPVSSWALLFLEVTACLAGELPGRYHASKSTGMLGVRHMLLGKVVASDPGYPSGYTASTRGSAG